MAGSNTFGGTIKLEGEKAYREAIKQINSDLKVMASEMGKVTAEFGKMINPPLPSPLETKFWLSKLISKKKKY